MPDYTVSTTKILLAVTLLAAFGVMTSIFMPRGTVATQDQPGRTIVVPPPLPANPTATNRSDENAAGTDSERDPHDGFTLLGTLESGTYHVEMYAAEEGVLYSVYDPSGQLLGLLMSADEAEAWFSDLHLSDLIADHPIDRDGRFTDLPY